MGKENFKKYLAKFAIVGKSFDKKGEYLSQNEWKEKGIANFKKRTLGFWGIESHKSLDELVEILMDLKMVDSVEEGKDFMGEIYGKELHYGSKYLEITQVFDKNDVEHGKIKLSNSSCEDIGY